MTAIATISANSVLTSTKVNEIIGGVNGFGGLFVRKTLDENVISNTTLQADDELILPVAASSIYAFDMLVLYTSGTTPDIKFGWTVPSGTTMKWTMWGALAGVVTFYTGDQTLTGNWDGAGGLQSMWAKGQIITSSTPGNVVLTWAQNTSNATNTTVNAGSYINAFKVG